MVTEQTLTFQMPDGIWLKLRNAENKLQWLAAADAADCWGNGEIDIDVGTPT